ncbi:unnamed protein product [Macrosiphum euphorbiae]|uniref:Uncharacterized protein n=1 Tax=Macrosiphum euphorbiae TaxID=13131 RepID=A0AAV0WLQ0_9HEMI|nr:unnamed protein product [Macrosiphum euphorbiae]
MKSERISGIIESSSSEVNESSNSPKSCNDSSSQKSTSFIASTYGSGGDPISVETLKVVDRYAEESLRFIDDGDGLKIEKQPEIENKMSKRSSDEDRLSTDRPMVENDSGSGFNRYDAKDSGQSLCTDGDGDCDDSSLMSSWLLDTDEIITDRRSRPSPNKRVKVVTATAVKGRKKKNPALGRKKAITQLRGSHSTENRNPVEGLSSSFLPPPPHLTPVVDSGKYFANTSAASSSREQQIKDTTDSVQSFCTDGDRDCDDSSLASSWLLETDEIITGRRFTAVTTAVKGRKKRKPALGRKKALARLRGLYSPENGNSVEGLSDDRWASPSRQQRAQQIKDAYAAPEENNRTSAAAVARRTTGRCHEASSLINRRMGNREITRTNKIIVDKILNVRTTIPKTKK